MQTQALTTQLFVAQGREREAFDFYERAFGAAIREEFHLASGGLYAADMVIGDVGFSVVGANPRRDRSEGLGPRSPDSTQATTCSLRLRVKDAPAALERAVQAGALSRGGVDVVDVGGCGAGVTDPFGHIWFLHQPS
jgi:PhnB protein